VIVVDTFGIHNSNDFAAGINCFYDYIKTILFDFSFDFIFYSSYHPCYNPTVDLPSQINIIFFSEFTGKYGRFTISNKHHIKDELSLRLCYAFAPFRFIYICGLLETVNLIR